MELEQQQFERLYGAWAPLAPAQVAALLGAAPFRWWIAGGWAIELAGGRARRHEDTDVLLLREDIPAIRKWLAAFHLWIPNDGTLTLLTQGRELPPDEEQLWMRRDALQPWLADLLLNPSAGEEWVFKRNEAIRLPLDEIGTTVNGVNVLRPHVALLHKAKNGRRKDDGDFESLLPLLDARERAWLDDALAQEHPDHAWRARLGSD